MRRTLERELKLEPDPGFALPELPGEPLEDRLFSSTYYDTPPRSLARVGITLRRRLENGVSLWQLKLPREGGRDELEAHGGPIGPPPQLSRLLAAHLRHGALEELATLRTRRTGIRVADGDRPVADVTVDAVDILDSGHTTGAFTELEIELVDGDDDDLERLGRALRRAGAHRSDGRPKLMRVLDLPQAGDPASDAPALEQIRAQLLAQLHAIEAHDPGVRLGDDAEDVHRMRVATRRTRALIRATRPLLGDNLADLGSELKWLASLLGDVRDLDVLLARVRAQVAEIDVDRAAGNLVVTALEAENDERRRELLEALDSERYLDLLARFEQAIDSLPPLDAPEGLDPLAARPAKKLARAAKRLPDEPSDAELHDLRKRAKKARYAAELAALAGRKPVSRFVDALKDLQDVVGEHQDAVVAEERLRALAAPVSALAVGRLVERERARRAQARADYPAVLAKALARGSKALLT